MKHLIMISLSMILVNYAYATPNYVDCSKTSTPMVEKRVGSQGFGILYSFPEEPVVVSGFVYSKQKEMAWAQLITGGVMYRVLADCKTKISNGVFCVFDLSKSMKEHKPADVVAAPLADYVTRFYANVIDKNVQKDEVEIQLGVDTEPNPHEYSPTRYQNLNTLDNYYKKSCDSRDEIAQG